MRDDDYITVPYDANIQMLASCFDCDEAGINGFLRSPNALNPMIGKTYVYLSNDNRSIIGYYNISTAYLKMTDEYGTARIGGSIHICYFALDKKYHGIILNRDQGGNNFKISDLLLDDCIKRIDYIRHNHVGFSFVSLAATPRGKSLYTRNGFEEIEEDMGFPQDEIEIGCTNMFYTFEI